MSREKGRGNSGEKCETVPLRHCLINLHTKSDSFIQLSDFRAFRISSLTIYNFFFLITTMQKSALKARDTDLSIPLLYFSKWIFWKHTKNICNATRRSGCTEMGRIHLLLQQFSFPYDEVHI